MLLLEEEEEEEEVANVRCTFRVVRCPSVVGIDLRLILVNDGSRRGYFFMLSFVGLFHQSLPETKRASLQPLIFAVSKYFLQSNKFSHEVMTWVNSREGGVVEEEEEEEEDEEED